jgi:hypothetical protein
VDAAAQRGFSTGVAAGGLLRPDVGGARLLTARVELVRPNGSLEAVAAACETNF